MSQEDPLKYTKPFQLTKTVRQDPYDAILPAPNAAAGRLVLITGAGTGIGAAAAEVWARAGAESVVLAARRLDKLEETAEKMKAINGGKTKTLVISADLVEEEHVCDLFKRTVQTFGRAPDVVLANAGLADKGPIADTDEVNLKGVYACAYHFMHSQPDPSEPQGTFVVVNSGLGGVIEPGMSAYSISKLASQRLLEYLATEVPTMRSFTLLPGVVKTPMNAGAGYNFFANDHADLTGLLSIWLCKPEADYLKGGLMSVNWDVDEMEATKDKIVQEQLLRIKWHPVLPASGGSGIGW